MIEKLNNLVRKKYILFGVPLLCGVIIGTTITMSLPHAKAAVCISDYAGGPCVNETTPTQSPVSTVPTDPTTVPQQTSPTTSPDQPTSVPVAQPTTTSSGGGGQTAQPCH